ncbi:right-handed parallel beta-helix repeat-containing protein [Methanobrevibacter sp.]
MLVGENTEIYNSNFTRNVAGNTGGAININGGNNFKNISNCIFRENNATEGGVLAGGGGQIVGSTFIDNKALSGKGGALNLKGVSSIKNSTFKSNTATSEGGAIYSTKDLEISKNSIFEDNVASSKGGAISSSSSLITVSDTVFRNNNATGGGAIYTKSGIIKDSDFISNYALTDHGGAIYTSSGDTLFISNSTFESNKAINTNKKHGGALYIQTATTTIENSTFKSNTATSNGGAIYSTKDLEISKNSIFEDNVASGKGGAISSSSSSLITVSNAVFKNNNATSGGAILYNQKNIEIHNSTFIDNSATSNGGAIESNNNKTLNIKIYNSRFIHNTAGGYGGAMLVGENSEFHNSNFTRNVASKSGGAININGDMAFKIISGCKFEENNASEAGGAFAGGVGEIENSQFIGNNIINKKAYGSAIKAANGLTIVNSNFTSNVADSTADKGYGGTVYNNAGTLTVTGSLFDSNIGRQTNFNILNKGTLSIQTTTFKTIDATLEVDKTRMYSGEEVGVSGKFDIGVNDYPVNIEISADGTVVSDDITVVNGVYAGNIKVHQTGDLTLTINNIDDVVTSDTNKYVINDIGVDIYVDKIPVKLIASSIVRIAEGEDVIIDINLTDINGNPLSGEVVLHINGSDEIVSIVNGYGNYTKSGYPLGEYPFSITYENDIYQSEYEEGTVIVKVLDYHHTYTELQKYIDDTPEYGTLVLPYYFMYTDYIDKKSFPSGVIINKPITIDGNGTYISGEDLYRIFNITSNNVVLKNITFINGSADNGGAVYIEDGISLTVNDCSFSNNSVSGNGSGIYAGIDSTLNINGTTFSNNNASVGGAIYSNNLVNIFNSTFINNFAIDGGAIFTKDSNIDQSKFYNNTILGHGGGLFSTGDSYITNSLFDGNKVIDSTENFNIISPLRRGGDAVFSTGTLKINYTNITNSNFNYFREDNKFLLLGAVTFLNSTEISNSLFDENYGCYGGAITSLYNSKNPMNYSFSITNSVFTGNNAYNGGGIYVSSSNNDIKYCDIVFALENCTFYNNTASHMGSKGYAAAGGALVIVGTEVYGNITSCNFTSNRAYKHPDTALGGAISFEDAHLKIDKCNFTDNYADRGGAIEYSTNYDDASAVITNSNFINNTAIANDNNNNEGGAITMIRGSLTIVSSNFINNTAVNNRGGAIIHADNLNISDSNFINNTATQGGAIISIGVTSILINNTNFTDNIATSSGGALFVSSSNIEVLNSNFNDNNASTYGGAIYSQLSNVGVFDSNFTDNVATSYGGAVFSNQNVKIDIDAGRFSGNNASYGGAVAFNKNSEYANVTNSNFSDNFASNNGGAVYSNGGYLNIENTDFVTNNASNSGGAIYSTAAATPTNITNAYFNKNIAVNGSAIFLNNNKMYIADTEFGKNRADSYSLELSATPISYYPGNITAEIIFKGKDNIMNAIYNNGAYTNVYLSNVTYEVNIHGNHINRTTSKGFINPNSRADDQAEVWQDIREDSQLINIVVTSSDGEVVFNKTDYLTDVYGNLTAEIKGIAPGIYTLTAQHLSDDYYTYIADTTQIEIYDLAVNKTTDDVDVFVEENVTYDINLYNDGPHNLSDITVIESVPDGFILLDYNRDNWDIIGESENKLIFRYTGNNGILESKMKIVLTLTFNATKAGKFNNTIQVSSNETNLREVNSSNETTVRPFVDLNIVKEHNLTGDISVDDLINFTITVTNNGRSNATNVNITDILNNVFEIVSIGNESLIDYNDNHKLTWIIPKLNKGETTQVNVIVKILANGTYNNTAYAKSDESDEVNSTADVTAQKIATHIDVENVVSYPGKNVTIHINVTSDDNKAFNGDVTIKLPDGSNPTVNIINGKGNITWFIPDDFIPKVYNDTVNYEGNYKYIASSNNGTVTVNAVPTVTVVENVEGKAGQDVTVPVNVTAGNGVPFNGNVTVVLPDGSSQTVNIVNGKGSVTWSIPEDYNGTYNVSARFFGNETYLASNGTGVVNVDPKHSVVISVDEVSVYPGQNFDIPINVTTEDDVPFNGNVTVTLPDGSNQTVEIVNGSGNATWSVPDDFAVGSYDVAVDFAGEDDYFAKSDIGTVNVVAIPTVTVVENVEGKAGQSVTVPVNVTADNGVPFNGNVAVVLPDGSNQTVNIVNGNGEVIWSIPEDYDGTYDVSASFLGNETYLASNGAGVIVVDPKHSVVISVDEVSVYPGRDVVIPVNVTADDGVPFNGVVTVTLPDGSSQTVKIVDGSGSAVWSVPNDFVVGSYDVAVDFAGDDDYFAESVNGTVNVVAVPIDVTVGNVTVKPGQNVTIPIVVNTEDDIHYTGTIDVLLPDGTNQAVEVVDGIAEIIWYVPDDYDGVYDVIIYGGNQSSTNSSGKINVLPKLPVYIIVGNITTYPGKNITIPIDVIVQGSESLNTDLPDLLSAAEAFNGNVIIHLPDGSSQNVEIIDGSGRANWFVPYDYSPTVYDDNVEFKGDEDYLAASANGTITVLPIPTQISVGNVTASPGDEIVLPINVKADNDEPFNGNVIVTLPDGSNQTVEIVNGKGNVNWNVPDNYKGVYNVLAIFNGNKTYLASEATGTITVEVNKVPVDIIADDVVGRPGEKVTIPIKVVPKDGSVFNGYVTVILPDGSSKRVEIINGKGSVDWIIPQNYNGDYGVKIIFDGDDHYYPSKGSSTVHVIPEDNNESSSIKHIESEHVESILEKYPTANPIFILILALLAVAVSIKRRK